MKKIALLLGAMLIMSILTAFACAETAEMKTFTLSYDTPWQIAQDKQKDESITMIRMDGDTELTNVYICVSVQNPGSYRSTIRGYGYSDHELVVNNAYELYDIAGVSCLINENGNTTRYVGRCESRNVTLYITIKGDAADETVSDLLAGIEITAEDVGNVDVPWPWEGVPFEAGSYTYSSDKLELSSEMLAMDPWLEIYAGYSGRIAVAGKSIYLLKDGTLYRFTEENGVLTQQQVYELNASYVELQSCDGGKAYLSASSAAYPLIIFDENGDTTEVECQTGALSMHPSGEWGISWKNSGITRATLNGDTCVIGEEIPTPAQLKGIDRVYVSNEHIFICGTSADLGNHTMLVCDLDCNVEMVLGNAEMGTNGHIAYVYGVMETDKGIMALDGNMKTLVFWDKNGRWLGKVKGTEIFGCSYAWTTGCTFDRNGSILISMKQTRPDDSCDEVLIYRLHGFSTESEIIDTVAIPEAETEAEAVSGPETTGGSETTTDEGISYEVVNCKSSVNLRSEPNTDCAVVTTVPKGATVTYAGETFDKFVKVEYNGYTGYISQDFLSLIG